MKLKVRKSFTVNQKNESRIISNHKTNVNKKEVFKIIHQNNKALKSNINYRLNGIEDIFDTNIISVDDNISEVISEISYHEFRIFDFNNIPIFINLGSLAANAIMNLNMKKKNFCKSE